MSGHDTTSGDTIFALSTAAGRAGVAVFRISGPHAGAAVMAITGRLPAPRHAVLRTFRDPVSGAVIDRGLVLWFPAPASFSGEDMAELHCHGGRAVVLALRSALHAVAGCRPAEAGEFARRAFENGKLDLTQAEGLADLIDADTEAQRVQALAQSDGVLAGRVEAWRGGLLKAMALTEAAIDFSDEADVADDAVRQAEVVAGALAGEIARCLDDGRRGEIVRDGFKVALVGAPNAGKSSLLNALAQREAAIVSDEPGTTRDLVEVRLDLSGHAVIVTDTAGLRESDSQVEREGMRRSAETAQRADLVVWLDDAGEALAAGQREGVDAVLASLPPDRLVRVVSKADLLGDARKRELSGEVDAVILSSRTGEGIGDLIALIVARAGAVFGAHEPAFITQARHRQHLTACLGHLRTFLDSGHEPELRAEDLRRAASELARLTGRIDVEEVLGEIFGRFCIGK